VSGPVPSSAALAAQLESPDFNTRALALAELVRRGLEAAPALRGALESSSNEAQTEALRGLAEIADPASADSFAFFLAAPDERLRAYAARGLARIGDARARDALVRTIDDFPDDLHYQFTPAVVELIALGPAALPLVAPLLSASGATTRERAFFIIRRIVEASPALEPWDTLVAELGAFHHAAPDAEREPVAQQWRAWIAAHVA